MRLFSRLCLLISIILATFITLAGSTLRQAQPDLCQNDITEVRGKLIYDSSFSRNGNTLMTIRLSETTNSWSNTTTADGILTLVTEKTTLLAAGTCIHAVGKMAPQEDSTDLLFLCKEFTVYKKTRFQVFRERLIEAIQIRILGTDSPSDSDLLGLMLILGISDESGSRIRERARSSGCIHVLALSGMHLNIIAGLFGLPFRKKKNLYRLSRVLTIPAVTAYMIAVYPRPSLVRAFLMFILQPLPSVLRLSCTFIIHCLIFPGHILNQGFLFGYAAVFGLILLRPAITRKLKAVFHPVLSKTPSTILSVAVFTAPLQLITYGLWYPVSVLSGPVCAVLITIMMYTYLAILVFGRYKVLLVLSNRIYGMLDWVFEKSAMVPTGGLSSLLMLFAILAAVSFMPGILKAIVRRIENRGPAWYNHTHMWQFDYTSVSDINRLLNENGLGMTKKFGQNFLISDQALVKIVDLAGIDSSMKVWEVGPGIGALTTRLVATGADVTAFEIDHGFCRILRDQVFTDDRNFTLIEGDAMKTWKAVYEQKGCPDVICANLPYNVGSVLIASFIENRMLPSKMVFTLQTEVVKRICSGIGDDQYSGFSIVTSLDYVNKEALKLRSSNFWPAPNVDSSVVVMTKREKPQVPEEDAVKFLSTVRALFVQRRKTVKNNLKALAPVEKIDLALDQLGISPTERAEKLTVDQILGISRLI